jgi:hypothetical protein
VKVIGGDESLIETILVNALRSQEKSNFAAVASSYLSRKVAINYLVPSNNMAAVYLGCDPRTYEVFLTEQEQSILPDCSKLGTNLKFGRTYNINDRESTYKSNGVFVLVVVSSCLCDSHLLEENLRAHFSSSRIANTQEYLRLTSLRRLFKEPHARSVLARVKETILHETNVVLQHLPELYAFHVRLMVYLYQGDIAGNDMTLTSKFMLNSRLMRPSLAPKYIYLHK